MESNPHDQNAFTRGAPRQTLSKGLRRCAPVLLLVSLALGCERAPQPDRRDDGSEPARHVSQTDVLFFPDELHVSDASVNDFVTRAMTVCGSGDYEAFRLLWATHEEPLARRDYEQGWQAVEEIRIQAVEKVQYVRAGDAKEAPHPISGYLIAADVRLDPLQPTGKRGAGREVVLLMVQEGDAWRLAAAPRLMRTWIQALLVERAGAREEKSMPDGAFESRPGA